MGIKPFPRPGISWSAMRKILEQENICNSLNGRIQYFQTRYKKAHDQPGRVAIRLDGKEIFQCDNSKFGEKYGEAWYNIQENNIEGDSLMERHKKAMLSAISQVGAYSFYDSFYEYRNNSICKSLTSPNAMVRLFAILDKRVGKRRLEKLVHEVKNQPEWLQIFFKLRFEAEKIVY